MDSNACSKPIGPGPGAVTGWCSSKKPFWLPPARADIPPQLASWRHMVRQRLPFTARVLYSEDDPYCEAHRARGMAADWGASASGLGAIGHVNTQSGLGDWPAGLQWLQGLLQHGTSLERT